MPSRCLARFLHLRKFAGGRRRFSFQYVVFCIQLQPMMSFGSSCHLARIKARVVQGDAIVPPLAAIDAGVGNKV